MRLRRSAVALLAAAALLSACGQDAPEFGASPDAPPPAAEDDVATYDAGENAAGVIGETVGTMAPSTTVPSTPTTLPAPTTTPTTAPVAPDPAVQGICDRVSIFLVTAAGLGPTPSPVDADMLDDAVSQLLDDGALLYGMLSAADQDLLTGCLDEAVQAAP